MSKKLNSLSSFESALAKRSKEVEGIIDKMFSSGAVEGIVRSLIREHVRDVLKKYLGIDSWGEIKDPNNPRWQKLMGHIDDIFENVTTKYSKAFSISEKRENYIKEKMFKEFKKKLHYKMEQRIDSMIDDRLNSYFDERSIDEIYKRLGSDE